MRDNYLLFFTLYALTFIGSVFSKELLGTEELYYGSLAGQLTNEQLQQIQHLNNVWGWIGYVILPLLLYLKILFIAVLLATGIFFFDLKLKFGQVLNIVIRAEFVFLLPMVMKTAWFYFFKIDYTFDDIQYHMPLSLESLFGYANFERWYIYPMQVINLFEVTYWIILSVLLARELQISRSKALVLVAGSYGAGVALWVTGVMFLLLNFG